MKRRRELSEFSTKAKTGGLFKVREKVWPPAKKLLPGLRGLLIADYLITHSVKLLKDEYTSKEAFS